MADGSPQGDGSPRRHHAQVIGRTSRCSTFTTAASWSFAGLDGTTVASAQPRSRPALPLGKALIAGRAIPHPDPGAVPGDRPPPSMHQHCSTSAPRRKRMAEGLYVKRGRWIAIYRDDDGRQRSKTLPLVRNSVRCGACTIRVDGRRVNSCLTLAVAYDGAELVTASFAVNGDLHPVQRAFIEHYAFQASTACRETCGREKRCSAQCGRRGPEGPARRPRCLRRWVLSRSRPGAAAWRPRLRGRTATGRA
jgi:hypothetical protein